MGIQSNMLPQYAGLVFLLSCCALSAGGATNDGEKAMQQLNAAEVKLEQKLSSMMSELGSQLKQAQDTNLPLKRKKRASEKRPSRRSAGHSRSSPGRNPMSKYTMAEITSIFTSVRLLRAAFDTLMENYSVWKNREEELKQLVNVEEEEEEEEEEDDEESERDPDVEEGSKSEDNDSELESRGRDRALHTRQEDREEESRDKDDGRDDGPGDGPGEGPSDGIDERPEPVEDIGEAPERPEPVEELGDGPGNEDGDYGNEGPDYDRR